MKSKLILKGLFAIVTAFLINLNISNVSAQCLDQTLVGDCYYDATSGTSQSMVAIYLSGVTGAITVTSDNPTIGNQTINSTGFCPDEVLTFSVPADGGSYTVDVNVGSCSETISVTIPSGCTPNASCDAANEIGGVVFQDYNANGIQESAEVNGIAGVFVSAFGANGNVYSIATGMDGAFSLMLPPSAYPARIEYSSWPGQMVTSPVQVTEIYNAGTCDANLGLYYANEFCETDPNYATSCYIAGDPLPNGIVGDSDALVSFNNASNGTLSGPSGPPIAHDGFARDMGTIYGLAFNSGSQKLFMASVLKRHAGLGSLGLGGIYVTDYNVAPPATVPLVDIDGLGGVDVGSIGSNTARGLTPLPLDPNMDVMAWEKILKEGLGDMDISADGNTLYVTNLFERNFIAIDLTTYNTTGAAPTAADITEIPGPPASPCSATSEFRPFALKQSQGKLLTGWVCTGENGGTAADLEGYIYSYDLASGTWNEELSIPLCYERDIDALDFNPWSDDISEYTVISQNDVLLRKTVKHPQPYISDIEVAADGSLVIAIGDRTGMMIGRVNFGPDTNDGYAYSVFNGGDILKAHKYDNFYLLENGGNAGPFSNSTCLFGQDGGPGGGEFYCDEPYLENDVTVGGLAMNLSSDQVLSTGYDPFAFQSGGIIWYDNTNGSISQRLELYNSASGVGNFGKGTGLGDLEPLCSAPPTFVGNLVWEDLNQDGVRDPNEPGIPNLELSIFDSAGALVATTNTDADGYWSFTDTDGLLTYETYTVSVTDFTLDTATGVLNYNSNLYQVTDPNVGEGSNPDLNDSDATTVAGVPSIVFTIDQMGYTDTSLDFGFAAGVFDLAMNKVAPAGTYAPGDDVTFTFNVFNQGADDAYDIEITDYIQGTGLTFDAALNTGWTANAGRVTATFPGPLAAGADASYTLILTVDPGFTGSTIDNFAEIVSADDDTNPGNTPPVDIDSNYDTNQNNDNYDPANNDVVDGSNGDEDDSDGEELTIFLPEFDLALSKTVTTTNPTVGGQVTYDIVVSNEGNIDAYAIEVTDYIPAGLSYASSNNANGWALASGNAVTTIAGPLAPGTDQTVTLVLNIDAGFQGTSIVNAAEISAADDDTDPNNTPPNDIDSLPDNDPTNDGGGAEDDYDEATINFSQSFDLALIKVSNGATLIPGGDITYTITVFNQGTLDATNVEIIDYLPSDLTLNTTIPSNSVWTQVGANISTSVAGPIAPGGFEEVDLVLTLDQNFTGTSITNEAEIFAAEDANGPATDADSTPDQIQGNDTNGGDDVVDNSNGDEDDHDADTIGVDLFDLSLQKDLAAGQTGPFTAGSPITFTITVSNDGDIAADNISLVDYFGTDLVLNDADWADQGDNTATITLSVANGGLASALAPGASASVDITFNISSSANGSLTNAAEITGATDENGDPVNDIDSIYDNDPNNDPASDDDNDSVTVTLEAFDLALVKTLAAGQTGPFAPGGPITYTITVTNEGGVAADNISIVDYFAPDLVLNDSDWADQGDGTATITLTGAVAPGASTSVDITFTIATTTTGTITNAAEITGATDDNGNPVTDIDSIYDNDPNNDPASDDDNDSITTSLADFDLALAKTLAAGQNGPFAPGLPITYTLTVTNEGGIAADNISLVDYFSSSLILNDSDWADQGDNTATITLSVANGGLSSALAPGQTASVDITFTISATANGSITNSAEITGATDEFGNPVDDIDSIYDNDPNNDPASDDDNDTITTPLASFDLALSKAVAAGQPAVFSPGDEITYTITVSNEGGIAADNIEVTDYYGPGHSLVAVAGGWLDAGNNTAFTLLSVANGGLTAPLAPGASVGVNITLTILEPTGNETSVSNSAEISQATDDNGNTIPDVDSVFDNDPNNDINEDDNDTVTVPLELGCNDVFDCPPMDACTRPMTPVTVCPETCNLAPGYTLVDANTLFNCSVSMNANGCLVYTPLPGMEGIGHDEIYAVFQDVDGCLHNLTINMTIGHCGCINPLVEDCIAPFTDFTDFGHYYDCPEFCALEGLNYQITDVNSEHDCSIVVTDDGLCFDYQSLPAFQGVDIVTIVACTPTNFCDTVVYEITVGNCNGNPPVANGDAFMVDANPINLTVLDNDYDPDGDQITLCGNTQPSSGTLVQTGNTFNYTPVEGFVGQITFDYTVCDPLGNESTATVTLIIDAGCENAPQCVAQITELVVCPDFCGLTGPITITNQTSMYDCSVTNLNNECIRYLSLPAFVGVDQVTVTACDIQGNCQDVVLEITVGDCNGTAPVAPPVTPPAPPVTPPAPPATCGPYDLCIPQAVAQEVCPQFCNLNSDYSLTSATSSHDCQAQITNAQCFQYLSLPLFLGLDEVSVTACDGAGNCETVVMNISVAQTCGGIIPLEDAPVSEEKSACEIELPNGFSPNGDSVNEYFRVKAVEGCTLYDNVSFKVFTSTGQLVYEQLDSDLERILWDGTHNNEELPEGTYFYVLQYDFNNGAVSRKGFIEMKR